MRRLVSKVTFTPSAITEYQAITLDRRDTSDVLTELRGQYCETALGEGREVYTLTFRGYRLLLKRRKGMGNTFYIVRTLI